MAAMTLDIDHDVAVVTIFNLQDVANQWVSRQTVAEIITSFLVAIRLFDSKLLQEVVI